MANEFTWHKVDEKEKEQIKNKAKEIMDSFSKKVGEVSLEDKNFKIREKSRRKEFDSGYKINREIMFSNAKEKNKDFIISETKKW
jgi:Asp-tRNA(Asn)/Glu-tRNA(Gln) amidotransferase C subunit